MANKKVKPLQVKDANLVRNPAGAYSTLTIKFEGKAEIKEGELLIINYEPQGRKKIKIYVCDPTDQQENE